jgi:hypothetical protein
MPTYVTLIRYTPQRVEKIKDSPTRLEAAKQSLRALGGELKDLSEQADRLLIPAPRTTTSSSSPSSPGSWSASPWPLAPVAPWADQAGRRRSETAGGR